MLIQYITRVLARARGIFRENRWLILGIVGAILAYIGGAGLHAVSTPWLLTADAPFHFDYAWQIYQGTLPEFVEGPKAPVDVSLHHNHRAAHHPPLYYTLLAPVVGPFIDSGYWGLATGVGRLVTLGIGALSLLAISWVGWIVGGRRRGVLAVAAPALAATFVPFVAVTSAIYSDALMVLFATLAFGLAAAVLHRGPRAGYLVCLAVVMLFGMATRVSFTSIFGLGLLAVVVSFLLHGDGTRWRRLAKGIGYGVATVLIVVVGIGWFYYFHNFDASGSLISARPESVEHARRYTPFWQVITSRELWYLAPFGLFGRSLQQMEDFTLNQWVSYLVFLLGVAGAVVYIARRKLWRVVNKTNAAVASIVGACIVYVGLVLIQQIVYATGYGMFSARYLLPAWVVAGLVLAFGLLAWQLRGVVCIAAVTAGWLAVVNRNVYLLATETGIAADQGWLSVLQSGALSNGFPATIVPTLLLVTGAGIVLVGIAIWQLLPNG